MSTVEVEKVKAGAQADIIFNGTREYDENGNVKFVDRLEQESANKNQRKDLLSMWDNSLYDDDEDGADDISGKQGKALYTAAQKICRQQMPQSCDKDMNFLRQACPRRA